MDTKVMLTKRAYNPDEMDEWMVNIDGFLTTYRKGTGLREGFKPPRRGLTVADLEDFRDERLSRTVDPTEAEILASLAVDASTVASCKDVDEFAREFCYGMKHSQTQETYDACVRALLFFQNRGLRWEDYTEDAQLPESIADDGSIAI